MPDQPSPAGGAARVEGRNMDLLVFVGIFALWIILQVWVLPKAGVST